MIKKIYDNYKEMILYLFFGGCTTVVNFVSFLLCRRIFYITLIPGTVIAWLFAVIFAYVTNRRYVFQSENITQKSMIIELTSFISCRLLTGFLDVGIMYIFVDLLGYNDLVMKILSNVVVIISNYAASRLFIFKAHDSMK